MAYADVLNPGAVLETRYEVVELLGTGGFGATYRAVDRSRFNEPCVVKALLPAAEASEIAQQLFEREAKALLGITHPRIPKLQAYFQEGGRYFLVQDFVGGDTLERRLERAGLLPEEAVRDIVLQVTEILVYLHGLSPPMIHRDIKPANLIQKPDGSVMLIDFGAVREALGPTNATTGTAIWSRGYTPYEQMIGHAIPASDIYALGATGLHLVTGKHPLDWHDPVTGRVAISGKLGCSPHFERVLERMLADVPDRLQTPQAVRSAMLGGSTTAAPPTHPHAAPTRPAAPTSDTVVERLSRAAPSGWSAPATPGLAGGRPESGSALKPDPGRSQWKRKVLGVFTTLVGAAVVVALFTKGQDGGNGALAPSGISAPKTPTPGRSGVDRGADGGAGSGARLQAPTGGPSESARDKPASDASTKRAATSVPPRGAAKQESTPVTPAVKSVASRSRDAVADSPANPPTPAPTRTVVDACASAARCASGGPFSATVTYVVASQTHSGSSPTQNVKITLKIKNVSDKTIVLAYRAQSEELTDDNGNRYANDRYNQGFIRGIGFSSRDGADPQFDLAPGESRDATFENEFTAGGGTFLGTKFDYELTLDELVVQGRQARLGRSHALNFRGLTVSSGAGAGTGTADDYEDEPAVGGPSAEEPRSPRRTLVDDARSVPAARGAALPCDDSTRCYDAGRFTATITHLWASRVKGSTFTERKLFVTIRIRNTTDAPIALAYRSQSEAVIDDQGNKYANERYVRGYIRGIGIRDGDAVDPQFVVAPGESREATFENGLRLSDQFIIGFTYSFDLTLDQLDLLPGGQERPGRSYAIGFHNLKETPSVPDPIPAAGPCAATSNCDAARPFSATVTRVWTAQADAGSRTERTVLVTVRLRNTGTSPLAYAYVVESGRIIDDAGNAYANDWDAFQRVRGIGMQTNQGVNAQFVLNPGEARDATFEHSVSVDTQGGVLGSVYDYTLTFAAVELLPGRQLRVLGQYSVGFHGLKEYPRTAAAATPGPAGPCAGIVSCNDAGAFTESVAELAIFETPDAYGMTRNARATLKFKNVSDHPITLTYHGWSQQLIDDHGTRYRNDRFGGRQFVQKIPVSDESRTSTDFTLAPGETRDALLYEDEYFHQPARPGNVFDYEMVIDEYEILPGRQLRFVRSHSVTFHGVKDLRSMRQKLMDALIKKP